MLFVVLAVMGRSKSSPTNSDGYLNVGEAEKKPSRTVLFVVLAAVLAVCGGVMLGVSLGLGLSSSSSIFARSAVSGRASGEAMLRGARIHFVTVHNDGGPVGRRITLSFDNSDVRETINLNPGVVAPLPPSGSLIDAEVLLDGKGGGLLRAYTMTESAPVSTSRSASLSKRIGLFFVTLTDGRACGEVDAPEACSAYALSESEVQDNLYRNPKSVVAFYKLVTRGRLSLVASDSQTFRVSIKSARDEEDVALQVERSSRTKPSSFDIAVFILPKNFKRGAMDSAPAGLGDMDGKNSWFLQPDMATIAHEMGHNLGLAHAGAMQDNGLREYGDMSSLMGGSYFGFKYGGLSAYSYYWLNRDVNAIVDITKSGIYTIRSLSSNADPNMARIHVSGSKSPNTDTFPGPFNPRRPSPDMNAGVFWIEWHEAINQDADQNDIINLRGVRGPLFKTLLIKTVLGPVDPWYNRVSVLQHRLEIGDSVILDKSNIKVTHIALGSMAVEYPGSPIAFTTDTKPITAAPVTTTRAGTVSTTAPGTTNYMCTLMGTNIRAKPEFASATSSVPRGTKFLFMGVPVASYAMVKDCTSGVVGYVPITHLALCGPNLSKLPCVSA